MGRYHGDASFGLGSARAASAFVVYWAALGGALWSLTWLPPSVYALLVAYTVAEAAFIFYYRRHARLLNAQPDRHEPPNHDAQAFLSYVMEQMEFYFNAFGAKISNRADVYLGPWYALMMAGGATMACARAGTSSWITALAARPACMR